MAGRLLELTFDDPVSNVAAEEAFFRLVTVPTLRVWRNQRSVIIGRAQLASLETDLEYCRTFSIPVVRRFTAGGAVFNGPGNLNWSFFVPKGASDSKLSYRSEPRSVFSDFGSIVVGALRSASLDCRFQPPNTIVTAEGKISGMAAYVSAEAVVCHGTLLIGADLEELERVTTPSKQDAEKKYPRSNIVRVSNTGVDETSFIGLLVGASGVDPARDEATREERTLIQELVSEKYSRQEWNLGDPFGLDYR